jgi:tyrosine-protein phosphatase SIW14
MTRLVRNGTSIFVVALLITGPVAYAYHCQAQLRNFRVVREGVLYRSGQMSLVGLKRMVHDYGIKTVISLRDAAVTGEEPPDLKEEKYCQAEAIHHYRIPPAHWWSETGPPPVEPGVQKFRAIVADPTNYPVLVHCFAGIHRSGAYCAIYRMEIEHWSNEQAIAEVKSLGYDNLLHEWDILDYLENYRPTWKGPAPQPVEPVHHPSHPKVMGKGVSHKTPRE